jgi:hypothetical protein
VALAGEPRGRDLAVLGERSYNPLDVVGVPGVCHAVEQLSRIHRWPPRFDRTVNVRHQRRRSIAAERRKLALVPAPRVTAGPPEAAGKAELG